MDNFFLYVAIGFCLIMVTYVARADMGAQSFAPSAPASQLTALAPI